MARKMMARLNLGRALGVSTMAIAAAALTMPTVASAQDTANREARGGDARGGGQVYQNRGQNRGERPQAVQQRQPQQQARPQVPTQPQAAQSAPGAVRENPWAQAGRNARARIEADQNRQRETYRAGTAAGRGQNWTGDRAIGQDGGRRAEYPSRGDRARGQVDRRVDGSRDPRGDDRGNWQNGRRVNDGRDDRNGWQNDRRVSADREGWRGGGNESWRNDRGSDNRGWDRGWRSNNRYDWSSYRARNRNIYSSGRYYSPYQNYSYRRLNIGFSLGSQFYSSRYWINDPYYYRLPEVYGPYRWVRYYDDVLLVDTYTGEVVDAIYDFYY